MPSSPDGDQREPSSPAPFPLGPGIETRHTHCSRKAADVRRFWLGRSAARRLLGLATRERVGKKIVHQSEPSSIACGRFSCKPKGESLLKKTDKVIRTISTRHVDVTYNQVGKVLLGDFETGKSRIGLLRNNRCG